MPFDLEDDLRQILGNRSGRFKGLPSHAVDAATEAILAQVAHFRKWRDAPDYLPAFKMWLRRVIKALDNLEREIDHPRFKNFLQVESDPLELMRQGVEPLKEAAFRKSRPRDHQRRTMELFVADILHEWGVRVSTTPGGVFDRVIRAIHADLNLSTPEGDVSYALSVACRDLPEHLKRREQAYRRAVGCRTDAKPRD